MFFRLLWLTRLPRDRKAVGEVIAIMLLFFGSITVATREENVSDMPAVLRLQCKDRQIFKKNSWHRLRLERPELSRDSSSGRPNLGTLVSVTVTLPSHAGSSTRRLRGGRRIRKSSPFPIFFFNVSSKVKCGKVKIVSLPLDFNAFWR